MHEKALGDDLVPFLSVIFLKVFFFMLSFFNLFRHLKLHLKGIKE